MKTKRKSLTAIVKRLRTARRRVHTRPEPARNIVFRRMIPLDSGVLEFLIGQAQG